MQNAVNKGCHDTAADNTSSLLLPVCASGEVNHFLNDKATLTTNSFEFPHSELSGFPPQDS